VESAFKLARAYHLARGEPGRDVIVARHLSYHGNTRGALDASGRPRLRAPYEPWLGQAVHVPAPAVQAVDTTAAGDAFIGGLSVALVGGRPLEEAVRYGVCAGALAVTRFGAQSSLPSAEEVDTLVFSLQH
jgi:sugar/nucleoside kinase (ribokinase family)